jgi:hypothetical protein
MVFVHVRRCVIQKRTSNILSHHANHIGN